MAKIADARTKPCADLRCKACSVVYDFTKFLLYKTIVRISLNYRRTDEVYCSLSVRLNSFDKMSAHGWTTKFGATRQDKVLQWTMFWLLERSQQDSLSETKHFCSGASISRKGGQRSGGG